MYQFPTRFVFIFILIIFLTTCSSDETASTEEKYYKDEDQQAEIAVTNFKQLLEDYKTSYVSRGAHAKAHGCVKAYFNVLNQIEDRFKHGVFKQPGKQYKAWIRFSNGHFDLSISKDSKNDARGMAIKLLHPPGEPLQIAANDVTTQDFLLTNSPVFFIKNIYDYNDLVEAPNDLLGFIFNGMNPFKWRFREIKIATKTLTPPPPTLLSPQFYSITAYKLGPHNIKYSAIPCKTQSATPIEEHTDPDFLRKDLVNTLQQENACFEFAIQLQMPEKNMSIEDPTVEWKESDSPFINLAEINIPKQTFDTPEQQKFCENLSFAPWHALPEHRPIGQFNRMRRAVYPASSEYRHASNHTVVPDNLDW